jgi:AraC-like DNA-binding protein
MTRARELLEFSRSTVDEIAATIGHDDASGLIRKERRGVLPSRECHINVCYPEQPRKTLLALSGVGQMTVACLLVNTLRAACAIHGLPAPKL